MARTNDFFSASYPEPWQVLGVKLLPFSLGHYIKLRALGNAFVSDEPATCELSDLVTGIVVCSMPSDPDPAQDPFWQWFQRPAKRNPFLWLLGKQPMKPWEREIYTWGKLVGPVDFSEKARLFHEYVLAHSQQPLFWILKEPGSEGRTGAHWSQSIASQLVSECGYSLREVYNVPLSKCLADYFRALESVGAIRLMTPEEIAACQPSQ